MKDKPAIVLQIDMEKIRKTFSEPVFDYETPESYYRESTEVKLIGNWLKMEYNRTNKYEYGSKCRAWKLKIGKFCLSAHYHIGEIPESTELFRLRAFVIFYKRDILWEIPEGMCAKQ